MPDGQLVGVLSVTQQLCAERDTRSFVQNQTRSRMIQIHSLTIFLLAIFVAEFADGARILGLFPLNGKSHFVMFQQVMKGLADKGHQVDVLSVFPQKKPYPNYRDLSLAGSVPVIVNNMSYELVQSFISSSEEVFIDNVGTQVCGQMDLPQIQKLIKTPPNDPPYDLVVVELFYANCYLAFGRHLNVPVVALTSSPMLPYTNEPLGNPLNTAYVPEIQEGSTSRSMTLWQRVKNTVVTWSMCYQSRYYTQGQDEVVKKHFGPGIPSIRQLEREISLLLVNSHHSLNGIRPMTPAVVEVGGLHAQDDDTVLPPKAEKWLNDSKDGFIYFSFGSTVTIESFPKKTIQELFSAFSKLAPLRVLMKVAKPQSLPPGLPKNVLTMSWVPQVKVLKHKNIRVFITHGGLMGTQEAVTFGVPLLGIPLFRDQPINIKNCMDRGTALSLDYSTLTSDDIVKAVKTIVYDPKYKKNMMDLSTRFLDRPLDARDTAVYWIEYIIKHGGDSLRSPAVHLTWWQLALLDVYGSIIAAFLITLYVIKLILFAIFNRLFTRNKSHPNSKKWN